MFHMITITIIYIYIFTHTHMYMHIFMHIHLIWSVFICYCLFLLFQMQVDWNPFYLERMSCECNVNLFIYYCIFFYYFQSSRWQCRQEVKKGTTQGKFQYLYGFPCFPSLFKLIKIKMPPPQKKSLFI